ncbi:HupE/UreJ family protein [soil metagenome]
MTKLRSTRAWLFACVYAALALVAAPALAHKASDSYLQVDSTDKGTAVRWDIALRDLDAALDLDTNEDGKLTWAEVKAAWPRIETYGLAHLKIEGCALRVGEHALEKRNDGTYAVMMLASDCKLGAAPVITYTLFREVDPTHRGIAKVQRPGQALALLVLDPTHPPVVSGGASSASPATPTTAGTDSAKAHADDAISPTSGWGFVREGIRHILTGYDHVLFLLCLLLPSVMRRTPQGWRPVEKLSQAVLPVVGIVSAFTVAHSITLGLAALKIISLSPAFIEPAIAVTIVLAALDNVWPFFPVRRVIVTFFFGLIHGFGFAGVLAELNLPTSEFAWALLQFNVGLEMGQLLIVVCVTALLFVVRQRSHYGAWVIRGGSYAAILVGVLWFIERTANVSLLPI